MRRRCTSCSATRATNASKWSCGRSGVCYRIWMRRALLALLLLLAASPLFAASFVKRLVVSSSNGNAWNGPCPHQFDFAAEITSRRRGDALIQWIRSDGATGAATTLRFGGGQLRERRYTLVL